MPFLELDRARAPQRGVTRWLTGEIRAAIAEGRLEVGTGLPPTRVVAEDLGVSRGVVVETYRRLGEEGLVEARVGHGTVVSMSSAAPLAPARASRSAPEIEIDLSPNQPDPATFPRAAWLRHERAVLADASAAELGYGEPQGHPALLEALAAWLARSRGMSVSPYQVMVVGGVAQAFSFLAQGLVARGRTRLGVEDPGSIGAFEHMRHWGMQLHPAPVDDHGVQVDAFRDADVHAVLVTPAHQFPLGVALSGARRRELLSWARAREALVIEDDYDAEQRHDRAPIPALQPLAPAVVAQTASVSKGLAPALRLGWVVPPADLLDDLLEAKYYTDLCSPGIHQLVLARLLASGDYEAHVRRQRHRLRQRRDALLSAVRDLIPNARVGGVAAGLHVTLTFTRASGDSLDDADLAARLAEDRVLVRALGEHRISPGPPGLVIGYAATTPTRLRVAVTRIARALPAGIA